MLYNQNFSRVIIIIAHRLGWISFVRPEIIERYLLQTSAVPDTKIAAIAGATFGIVSALLDGSRLIHSPADLQPLLAIRIIVLPSISMFLGILSAKAATAARDIWAKFYRRLADTPNQKDSPLNDKAALIGQV